MNCEDFSVAAVIVTYNRLEKLKIALKSYENQSFLPKYLIVVNNCSTDGTQEFLDCWKEEDSQIKKIIINTSENLGGSGGFYIGQEIAMNLDCDWVYLADDDAYPEIKYFEKGYKFLCNNNISKISIICGKVKEFNNYNNGHRGIRVKKRRTLSTKPVDFKNIKKGFVEIDFATYVGIFINKKILEIAGLVNKKYFIWHDDTEHNLRLRKYGKFICLLNCEIIHDVEKDKHGLTWKDYYGYRNLVDIYKKYFTIQCVYLLPLMLIKAVLCPLKGKSLQEQKLRLIALKDGIIGNFGKHKVYTPGWKP